MVSLWSLRFSSFTLALPLGTDFLFFIDVPQFTSPFFHVGCTFSRIPMIRTCAKGAGGLFLSCAYGVKWALRRRKAKGAKGRLGINSRPAWLNFGKRGPDVGQCAPAPRYG